MHMDAAFCDVVLVVRTWMCFMICDMFVLHVDASSLGCWARGCPLDINVVLWLMYMDANVDVMQSFWFFLYIWMGCYGIMMHDGGVTWCD